MWQTISKPSFVFIYTCHVWCSQFGLSLGNSIIFWCEPPTSKQCKCVRFSCSLYSSIIHSANIGKPSHIHLKYVLKQAGMKVMRQHVQHSWAYPKRCCNCSEMLNGGMQLLIYWELQTISTRAPDVADWIYLPHRNCIKIGKPWIFIDRINDAHLFPLRR